MNNIKACGDCGVREGQIHDFLCEREVCPICGGQLISCFCVYKLLGLYDPEKFGPETAHLPPSTYENWLTDDEGSQWEAHLKRIGRVPFIQWPVLCAKCGRLWPEFFRVPDDEWAKYIQPDKRDKVVCLTCYTLIKSVIDKAACSEIRTSD